MSANERHKYGDVTPLKLLTLDLSLRRRAVLESDRIANRRAQFAL